MGKKKVFVIISLAALALTTTACKKKTTTEKTTTTVVNKTTTSNKTTAASKTTKQVATTATKFTVSFTGTKNAISNAVVEKGSKLVEPTVQEKEHYTFLGWFDGDTKWDFNNAVTKNMTLTAKYENIKYDVTYDLDGGSLEEDKKTVNDYEKFELDIPIKTGYTFVGWKYNDELITDEYGKSIAEYTYENNISVVASWQINKYDVNITNENPTFGSVSESATYDYDSKITLVATPNSGYKFVGWFDGDSIVSSKTSFEVTVKTNMNVIAKFEANDYTVTYDANGGILDKESKVVKYNEKYELDIPTKTGYTFLGWYVGDEKIATAEGLSIAPYSNTDNITVVAKWSINSYSVNLSTNDKNGCSVSNSDKYEYDTEITIEANVKTGYNFLGWFDGENEISKNKSYTFKVVDDITLVAKVEIVKITVTYDANGGVVLEESKVLTYGMDYELDIPTKTGYTFVGWYNDDVKMTDEYGKSLEANTELENLTYKAKWKINNYYIKVSSNNKGCKVTGENVYEYDTLVKVVATANEGYNFLGWFDGDTLLTKEKTYEFKAVENINLVAKVEAKEFKVTFDKQGGTLDKDDLLVTYGLEYELPVPKKVGYNFLGWLDSSNNLVTDELGKSKAEFNFTEDVTFKASYEIISNFVNTSTNVTEAGTITETNKYNYGENVELVATVNAGYTFLGWFSDDKLVTKELTCSFTMEDKELSYEARYSVNSYKISLNKGVGVLDNDDDVEVSFNSAYELPVATRANYDFLGWFSGDTQMTDEYGNSLVNYNIDGDVTLKAVWYETDGLKFTAVTGGYEVSGITSSVNGLKKIVVPEYYNSQPVIGIGKDGISVTNYIEEIVLPETVTYIGVQAFRNNTKLKSVKILGTVTNIGNYAFSTCANLESVDLKEGLDTIGTGAFLSCSKLALTATPTTVTSVGNYAFAKCTSITSFTLNTTYTGIEMFEGCSNLKTLVISDDAIHKNDMMGTVTNLQEITLKIYSTDESILFAHLFTSSTLSSIKYNGADYTPAALKTVNLSNTAKIHDYYFCGQTNITNIDVSCVTEYGIEAVSGAGIKSLTIKDGDKFAKNCFVNTKIEAINVLSDNYTCYYGCFANAGSENGLTINVGENVTTLKGFAESNVTSILFADNCKLTTIASSAFYGCTKLNKIIIPQSVTLIDTDAFNGCVNLLTVVNLSELTITAGSTTNGYVAYYALKLSDDVNA